MWGYFQYWKYAKSNIHIPTNAYVIYEWSLFSKSEISLTNWPGRSFYRHVTLKVDVKPTWNYPQFFCHMFYLNLTFWEFKLDSFTATFTHFHRSLNVWMLSGHLWPWTLFFFSFFLVIHWVQNFSTWLKNSTYIIIKTQKMFSQ